MLDNARRMISLVSLLFTIHVNIFIISGCPDRYLLIQIVDELIISDLQLFQYRGSIKRYRAYVFSNEVINLILISTMVCRNILIGFLALLF